MDNCIDEYLKLLEENIREADEELDSYLAQNISFDNRNLNLRSSDKFYIGIYFGKIEYLNEKELLYLSFGKPCNRKIHFTLYQLKIGQALLFDTKNIIAFTAFCADKLNVGKEISIKIYKKFLEKLEDFRLGKNLYTYMSQN